MAEKMKKDDLIALIEETVKPMKEEFGAANKELLARFEATLEELKKPDSRKSVGELAEEAEAEKGAPKPTFKSFGEQAQAIANQTTKGVLDPKVLEAHNTVRKLTGLGEESGSEGGFLVEPAWSDELYTKAHETGILPGKVKKLPVGPGKTGIKFPMVVETSRANGSRWGGIRGYWKGEAAQKTESKPKFGQMELSFKKLTGLCYVSDELLEDAVALEAFLKEGFAEEFGFKLDDAILNGDGAGKPLGIRQVAACQEVAKESGQDADTVVYENIVKMWSRMWARSRKNAEWYINQDVEPQLFTMGLSVGTGGAPVYVPPGGATADPYSRLYGRPVIPLEQCQTLGDDGDIILADMSQYVMIDRGGIDTATSIHLKFDYDETAFRFVMRVDGQPLWENYVTPFSGSTNYLSPYLEIADRT